MPYKKDPRTITNRIARIKGGLMNLSPEDLQDPIVKDLQWCIKVLDNLKAKQERDAFEEWYGIAYPPQ